MRRPAGNVRWLSPDCCALRQVAQYIVRRRRRQQRVAALEVALRPGGIAQPLARQGAIQMVRVVLAIELDRLAVILLGFGDAAELLQRVAAQGMEHRLARLQLDGLLGLRQRLRRLLFEQLAALVVGGVGRLRLDQEGDLAPVGILAAIQVCRQRCGHAAIGLDALLRRWMGGEHAGQPAGRFAARQADEGLLQFHRGLRVVTGAHHVADAVVVRLQLIFTTEAEVEQRRPATRREIDQVRMFLVRRQHRNDRRARRQEDAAFHRAGAVARGGMHDLVRQHRRQFGLALQFRQQAAIDRQLAAGKGPGIRHRIVDDDELERQVRPVADLHQLLPDLVDVGRKLPDRG
jgi:hypothetical protein